VFKLLFELSLFFLIILSVVALYRWFSKPDAKPSGVSTLDELGDEVDKSVKQFGDTKQKLADAAEKILEMKEKTDTK